MRTYISVNANSLTSDTFTSSIVNVQEQLNLATGATIENLVTDVGDADAAVGYSLLDPTSTSSSIKLRGITGSGVSIVGSDIIIAGGGGGGPTGSFTDLVVTNNSYLTNIFSTGASTIATLNVTGASTFATGAIVTLRANSIIATGASTFATGTFGDINVTGTAVIPLNVANAAGSVGYSIIDDSSTSTQIRLRGVTGPNVSVIGDDIIVGTSENTVHYLNLSTKTVTNTLSMPVFGGESSVFNNTVDNYQTSQILQLVEGSFSRSIVRGEALSVRGMRGNALYNTIVVDFDELLIDFTLSGYSNFSGTTFTYQIKGYKLLTSGGYSADEYRERTIVIPNNQPFGVIIKNINIPGSIEPDGCVLRVSVNGGATWRYTFIQFNENFSGVMTMNFTDNNFTTDPDAEYYWTLVPTFVETEDIAPSIPSLTYSLASGYTFNEEVNVKYAVQPYININSEKVCVIDGSQLSNVLNVIEIGNPVRFELQISDNGQPVDGYIVMQTIQSTSGYNYPVKFTDVAYDGTITTFTDTNLPTDPDAETTWYNIFSNNNYYITTSLPGQYELTITGQNADSTITFTFEIYVNTYRNLITREKIVNGKSINRKLILNLLTGDKLFFSYFSSTDNQLFTVNNFSIILNKIN